MALSLKTAEADELARSLARLTGETMTEVVTVALRERLARERARHETAATLTALADNVVRSIACRLRYAAGQPGGVGHRNWRRRVIVVDSSAMIAFLFGEPSAEALLARLAMDPYRVMPVAFYLETGTVLAARRKSNRMRAIDDLDRFLEEAGIALVPVDVAQSRLAPRARIQFGRAWVMGGC